MKVLKFLDKHLEEMLCVFLLATMTLVIFIQIVLKWFHMPLAWSEEVGRYLFIYAVYIGAAYSVKKRSHQKVELLTLIVKDRGKFVLYTISNLGIIVFAVVMAAYGWKVVNNIAFVHISKAPATHINMGWAYGAPAIGMSLCVIRSIQNIVLRVHALKANNTGIADGKGEGN